jgi:uncharacterized membrane protein YhaH (DUF805 family)
MTQLLSFKGRIGRPLYLVITIPLAFIFLLCIVWGLFAVSSSDPNGTIDILRISAIGWIVCVWPYFAAGVKRCHDRGKSGLWYLAWTIGCLACWIGGVVLQSWYVAHAGNLIALWTLFEMGALKGEAGPNRYGPPPEA